MTATCPWCSAPRDSGPACPRCGADYVKAEAIKAHGRAAPTAATAAAPSATAVEAAALVYSGDTQENWQAVGDPQLEKQFCLWAVPAALACALVFDVTGLGGALQRMFLTMPVHELGHAVTAWFCGFNAIPTVWKTLIPEARGLVAPVLLAGIIGYRLFRAWQAARRSALYICGALLLVQALCTLVLSTDNAQKWIIFGGDGMGMILAVLLMGSFYVGKSTQLYKGSLRWGFVVIGAAAFVDIYGTWWRAYRDEALIPFGTMDDNASDAMKLVETWQWSHHGLVMRYFTLGLICLIAIALIYAWGLWRANKEIAVRQQAEKRDEWARRRQEGASP